MHYDHDVEAIIEATKQSGQRIKLWAYLCASLLLVWAASLGMGS